MKVVIFDVDGTLYDQRKLNRYMLKELLRHYIMNPQHVKELKILRDFRRETEKRVFDALTDIENAQYHWGAQASGVSHEKVRSVVERWILRMPLRYIPYCRYPGVLEFFDNLHIRGIRTAVFSDYSAEGQMTALGLSPQCIVCSTDGDVDRLKPYPKGLFRVTEKMCVAVDSCLFIGDRDGECAREAGMPYLILEQKNSGMDRRFQTYHELDKQLEGFS